VARNNQVIRQWHLLRRLEGSAALSLQELAAGLPDDVPRHLRTVRRDLEALETVGFPLTTDQVNGQTRWKLLDGFRRLPALGFAPSELMALIFSRDLLKPLQGTYIHGALDSALTKASAALPPSGLDFVRQMREFLSVRFGPHKTYRAHREIVDRVTRATADRRTVQIRYLSASSGKTGRREVDPYHLWYAAGGLYLIGYCHRRRDVRMFAVERIRSLTITDHPYQLPLGFDVEAYVQDALVVMRGRQIEVELLFDRPTAAWVRDRVWHPSQHLTPLRDGRLRMTLRVADSAELVRWVLSFGRGVRVVRPVELSDTVQREALAVARQGRVGAGKISPDE
jgi:predicted DNA-binding transcriptional regulator YafY